MRVILQVTFPTEKFNELMRQGLIGEKLQRILEDTKPEAVYFGMGQGGARGVMVVIDVASAADLPAVSEPWYLTFDASIESRIVMSAEEIAKQDLSAVTAKYA